MLLLISTALANPVTLDEVVGPIDDKALARFDQCVSMADEAGLWTEWQDRCLEATAEHLGRTLPAPEERAEHTALVVPRAGPLRD